MRYTIQPLDSSIGRVRRARFGRTSWRDAPRPVMARWPVASVKNRSSGLAEPGSAASLGRAAYPARRSAPGSSWARMTNTTSGPGSPGSPSAPAANSTAWRPPNRIPPGRA